MHAHKSTFQSYFLIGCPTRCRRQVDAREIAPPPHLPPRPCNFIKQACHLMLRPSTREEQPRRTTTAAPVPAESLANAGISI